MLTVSTGSDQAADKGCVMSDAVADQPAMRNLYLLSRWIDKTPLNNPGLCGSDNRYLHALGKRLVVSIVDDTETPVAVGF